MILFPLKSFIFLVSNHVIENNLFSYSNRIIIMRAIIIIILLLICFILPINFYVMGEGVGFGLQGVVFQYKITGYGSNLFTLTQDMGYILNGNYTGKTMMSTLTWGIGSMCTIIATIIWLINKSSISHFNMISGVMLIIAGLTYLSSVMFQYGIFFNGSAGISIPFGIPLLVGVGYLIIKFRSPLQIKFKDEESSV